MTGPKTNEGATIVGERTGTRAVARYVRSSAYKAREVLNLIRGLDVQSADQLLQFTERDIAIVVRKALASAVANAQNNDSQDPEELYVSACFADEGPTLKRFRPRARGRAGRIRKRTCHITVVVSRLPASELEKRRQRDEARPQVARGRRAATSAQAARRERVARSREAAAAVEEHDHEDHDHEAHGLVGDAVVADTVVTDTAVSDDAASFGEGSHAPLEDGSEPEGFPIKGNADSMLYHVPDSRFFERTVAEVWFATEEAAEAAGYLKPPSQRDDEPATDDEKGDA